MRCLYCGKRLAILRKLTDSEFCTDLHRRLYHQEQEKMGLARLMDAQKRFSGFTAQGTPDPAPQNGKSDPKPDPASADAPREQIKSFLPYFPVARAIQGFLPISAAPLGQMVDSFLPEYRFTWFASPSKAGRIPIPGCQSKPPAFPPRLLHPESLPFERSTACQNPPVLWNSPSFAVSKECVWSWAQPRETAATRLLPSLEPEFSGLAPARPILAFHQLLALPGTPLAVSPQPDASVSQAPASISPDTEPAGFVNAVSTGPLSRILEPVETFSAIPLPPDPMETHSDAPAAPARNLLTLPKPGFVERRTSPRRVRARELFFPLLRLGDLPSLASRVARENIQHAVYRGVDCAAWTPGILHGQLTPGMLDDPTGRGADVFPQFPPLISSLERLPSFLSPVTAISGMAEAPRLDSGVSQPLPLSSPAPVPLLMEPVPEEVSVPAASTPRLTGFLRTPALGWRLSLAPFTAEATPGCTRPRSCGLELCDANPAAYIQQPALLAAGAPASLRLPASDRMAGVAPSAGKPSAPRMTPIAADWMIAVDRVTSASAVVPFSSIRGDLHPALANRIYALVPSEATPYPTSTVAVLDLSPLWPDAARTLPRLRVQIVEDREVREAVRAINAVLAQQKRAWIPRFGMPSIQLARADLKWFVMSVPVLLLLAVYSLTNHDSSPGPMAALQPATEPEPRSIAEAAPIAAPKTDGAKSAKSAKAATPAELQSPAVSPLPPPSTAAPGAGVMENVKQTILRRAAISLSDDFRSGLGDWEGRGKWSNQWAYDQSGFINTGPLAFYRPSMQLTDYRVEFLGQIEKKSLGWVFRGKDFDNYYAMKIIVAKSGPLPSAVIEHYAVINGKESGLQRRPLPIQIRTDTLYRVRMDVSGSAFTLSVQGQLVDYWSDDRLKSGGIGFFSAKGEQARLRWIEVSHQYDFLGRLCAFLAPYSLPVKDGSLKQ